MQKTITKNYSADSVMGVMGIDIAINAEGRIMVLHEKEFNPPVTALEYQKDSATLMFLLDDGTIKDYGMTMPEGMQAKMATVQEAGFFLIENKKIEGFYKVPVHQV